MSYQVLARKWRPQNFSELVGQEKVLSALVHGLTQNRLHHAYLFTGTRGVGKTTVARILAKSLNCEQGISATPCETCQTCIEIKEGRFVDLIEIDAASRTKVEDTRELLDNVQYAPAKGRFKVYLIDEVHMLSTHSFNALLKTLEEPPEHVKFLLATTDPQKLPITVLSRCLQFHLKNIEITKIIERLKFVLAEEKITFENEALLALAKAAEGSLRDALSLTDQAIGQGEGSVTTETTLHMLGQVHLDLLYQLAKIVAEQDQASLLPLLERIAAEPIDYSAVLKSCAELWYEVSLTQTLPQYSSHSFNPTEVQNLATALSPTLIQLFYDMATTGRKELPFAPEPRIGFNMTILRMLAFQPLRTTSSVQTGPPAKAITMPPPATAQTSQVEGSTKKTPTAATPAPSAPTTTPSVAEIPASSPVEKIELHNWEQLLNTLPLTAMTKEIVKRTHFDRLEGNTVFLKIESAHQTFFNDSAKNKLLQVLQTYYEQPFLLQITSSETPLVTLATKEEEARRTTEARLQEKLNNDPNIDFIKNNFNGKINGVKLT